RAPSIDWLKSFVKNSAALIASGDEYANALYNEYNKTQMTSFSTLKDEDIMNILAYVEAEAAKGPAVADTPAAPADGQAGAQDAGSSKYLNIIMVGMVIILLLLIIILAFLISAVKRFLDQKD